jgi:hypothetical protein
LKLRFRNALLEKEIGALGIADLELGFSERRRHPILETARNRAQSHQLAALEDPFRA